MDLTDLKPAEGSRHKKKREARGRAGYGGKTAGRGHNGQQSRAGGGIRKQFEGGQTPLFRRLPKRQYISLPNRKIYTIINLDLLESLDLPAGSEINLEFLAENKIVKRMQKSGLKVLGNGELNKAFKIKAHAFSEGAREKIEKAGGSIEKIVEKVMEKTAS